MIFLTKLLKYLKPYRLSIALVVLFTFIQALSELLLPTLMAYIVDIGIVNGNIPYILKIGTVMICIALLSTLSVVLASYLSAKVAAGFSKILREKVFAKVEGFSLSEFDRIGTSSLITRTTNDIMQIERVTLIMMRMMLRSPMLFIGGIIMAISRDATLSLLIAFIIPILLITIFIIIRKAMPLFKIMQKKIDKLNQVVREQLTGLRVIRAFNRVEHESKRFNLANIDLKDTAIRANQIMSFLIPIMMLMMNMSIIALVWFGSNRIDSGNLQIGDLMALIQYIMQILFSLIILSIIFIMLPRASVSAARINEVLDIEPDIIDREENLQGNEKKGYLEFKNVSFSYVDAEEFVIKDVSFHTSPGEVTAIIGGTGSGKSTLVKLIPRFYDISEGSILVNGVDIREMTQRELRSKMGFIPQKAVLFTGTIAENIRYGKEDATDAEVEHAAKIAQATEFISTLEDGFDSIVAQGGANFSGGQKQRLAIARALVRRPEIYVFDDSFSALDFKTDAKLRSALKEETNHSTIIIVAQRVSSIMNADRIIVLDEGKVVGIGKHKELLKNCEVYREIASSQLSEEELV